MRFLIFNAAVVAALIYLLSADRSEFRAAADQIYDNRLYDMVERVEDAARDGIERVGSAVRDSAPAEAPTETAATSEAVISEAATSEADPEPQRPRRLAAEAALVRDLPPVDDPAVAKRRAEVLDGIAALDSTPLPPAPEIAVPEVALAEGETLMGPEERLRELYTLAEEMELLFVTKLTR